MTSASHGPLPCHTTRVRDAVSATTSSLRFDQVFVVRRAVQLEGGNAVHRPPIELTPPRLPRTLKPIALTWLGNPPPSAIGFLSGILSLLFCSSF